MIFLYIGGGILAVIIILAIVAPNTITMERSVECAVHQRYAFDNLRSLKEFDKWSPFHERDPNIEKGYRGEDGEVGSVSWWKGNKQVGEGEQEITKIDPYNRIDMQLRFLKPFKATNAAWFTVKPKPDDSGCIVTWGFTAKFPVPMNIFMMFMNMEKHLGKDYEEGLARFKKHIEKAPASA